MNNQTLARPYAKAAFEFAQSNGQADAWLSALEQATQLLQDEQVRSLMGDPRLTRDKKVDLLNGLIGSNNDAFGNFVATLGENDRLVLVPAVLELFRELKAEAEKTLDVEVQTAFELSAEQLQTLAAALSKRLDRTVNPQQVVNPALIGGLVIRAGDVVVDGSVRGKLSQLAESLKS